MKSAFLFTFCRQERRPKVHELSTARKNSWFTDLHNKELRLAFIFHQNRHECIPALYHSRLRALSLESFKKHFLVRVGIDHEGNKSHVSRASPVISATFEAGGKTRRRI